jgi:hypothetical protein
MRSRRPTSVPHPAHHDRREPSTSQCRSCDAIAPACYGRRMGMCNGRPTRVPHPAPPRADVPVPSCDATAPAYYGRRRTARLPAHVCAAPGASRSQRAEHVPEPLLRRDPSRLPRSAAGCAQGGPRLYRILRLAIAASPARPRAARATRPPPPATAGGWECATP